MPIASIIIPTHDRPGFIDQAVESGLRQTLDDIEIIVVDNGSRPPCVLQTSDPRVRLRRREQDGGPCAARNDGLAAATGEYVTFLDDDDVLVPSMLAEALTAIHGSGLPGPVAALTGVQVVDQLGNETAVRRPPTLAAGGRWVFDPTFHGSRLTVNTLVAPRAVLDAVGGWDANLSPWEHDDLFLRVNAVCSLQGLDRPLYVVKAHGGARESFDLAGSARAIEATYRKHRSTFETLSAGTRAHYLASAGVYHLRAGHWRSAIRCTGSALRLDPTQARIWAWFAASLAGPRVVRRLRPSHPAR